MTCPECENTNKEVDNLRMWIRFLRPIVVLGAAFDIWEMIRLWQMLQ